MSKQEIILTPEELEDIKDTERYKVKVLLLLKQLNGIPDRVTKLEVKIWMIILGIPMALTVLGLVLQALNK